MRNNNKLIERTIHADDIGRASLAMMGFGAVFFVVAFYFVALIVGQRDADKTCGQLCSPYRAVISPQAGKCVCDRTREYK
jgi:hypothetical protein